ncbi:MAG: NADH-quinone oxidoreductase subunit NuoF [Acidobacteria bacterium]|nr:NADH-quinone oxidoreductase subunit NuoF [Acidobacteriota bacterium]NIM64324.1 NADH-quinone oxidoreductase subunit NuoF [Acidobacteriota bacterium]NIQ84967.1 NADH-quinone oxidoreductase subunit NuoF [Acidobacteriota bacterium]NIT10781.1 NADH-quinone oxidoreductase subunit NuoF [Acidobacteriota bacterium]
MEKVLTRNIHKENSQSIDVYLAGGGYEGLRKAVTSMSPGDVVEAVKKSGLRGRGGAGFPTGLKWSFMPKEKTKPHYLLCNADESEPGTFKDRLLMEQDPHMMIEGCMIGAYAMQADAVFVYIRGEFVHGTKVLDKAVAEAYEKSFAGKNICGSDWSCELVVHRGAGAYICGEETALMTSLEGERGYPRVKPPFPAQAGVWGMPTTINNVETLACVPDIIVRGADWFAGIGTDERNTGPKLYCLSGHVQRPGVYEAPMGLPLKELIYDLGGGMLHADRPLKACIPGGSSVPVLRAEECDVNLDFDSLAALKTGLGSAGIMVMDSSTCMVKALLRISHFYAHESCGQCTPCREGCGWMERILQRIEDGKGLQQDIDLLKNIADNIEGRTICALGDAAAWPVQSFVTKFRDEFQAHVDEQRCTVQGAAHA